MFDGDPPIAPGPDPVEPMFPPDSSGCVFAIAGYLCIFISGGFIGLEFFIARRALFALPAVIFLTLGILAFRVAGREPGGRRRR